MYCKFVKIYTIIRKRTFEYSYLMCFSFNLAKIDHVKHSIIDENV